MVLYVQQRLAQLPRLRRRPLKWQPCGTRASGGPATRCAQTGRPLKTRWRSAPRATTQRRRICASRCCREMVSIRVKKLFVPIKDSFASTRVGRGRAAFEASPEERSVSGAFEGLLSERKRVCRPAAGVSTAVVGTSVPDAVGSAATPNPCACKIQTKSASRW